MPQTPARKSGMPVQSIVLPPITGYYAGPTHRDVEYPPTCFTALPAFSVSNATPKLNAWCLLPPAKSHDGRFDGLPHLWGGMR